MLTWLKTYFSKPLEANSEQLQQEIERLRDLSTYDAAHEMFQRETITQLERTMAALVIRLQERGLPATVTELELEANPRRIDSTYDPVTRTYHLRVE